jgi:hypothetical protein
MQGLLLTFDNMQSDYVRSLVSSRKERMKVFEWVKDVYSLQRQEIDQLQTFLMGI